MIQQIGLREEEEKMEWTRSETLALATHSCVRCNGLGLRTSEKSGQDLPCSCVFRNVFRACYARFRECMEKEKYMSRVSLAPIHGRDKKGVWSRKDEEYVADFSLTARRVLSDAEYQVFTYHFLLGADWKLCGRKLNLDRGEFFHEVYRIQNKLGRVFAEMQPYALYPVSDYFHGDQKDVAPVRYVLSNVVPIRPPVSQSPGVQTLPDRKAA